MIKLGAAVIIKCPELLFEPQREKMYFLTCASKWKLRSACATAQSDQTLLSTGGNFLHRKETISGQSDMNHNVWKRTFWHVHPTKTSLRWVHMSEVRSDLNLIWTSLRTRSQRSMRCLHEDLFSHYENTPIQIYWNFYHQKTEFSDKDSEFLYISVQNIACGIR